MPEKQLIYVCSGIGSVFDSQVIELLNGICEKKFFQKNYLLLGIKENSEKLNLKGKKIHPGLIIIFYKVFPNYPFYNFLNRSSLRKALKVIDSSTSNTIFHTREEIPAWHLLNILDESEFCKILPDVRGANMEEVKQFFGFNSLREQLKAQNYKKAISSLQKVKRVSVVSASLKNYLANNFRLNPEKIFITPSLAGKKFVLDYEKREQTRKELNIGKDDILLIFSSGGVADWQNNNAVKLFLREGIKILNLSKKELLHKNIINKFVSYESIPDYLNAADIAIIWRKKSVVNSVASPVKFSEYLCCGLPVISNDNIDLVKNIITENNVGIILNNIDDFTDEIICEILKTDKQCVSQVGQNNFGLETVLGKYKSLYDEIHNR